MQDFGNSVLQSLASMSDSQSESVWGAVKSSLLNLLSPSKSETEIKIVEKSREVKALQEYETLVKGFEAAAAEKHTAVDEALGRFKTKSK